jgi:hypothetical protein
VARRPAVRRQLGAQRPGEQLPGHLHVQQT